LNFYDHTVTDYVSQWDLGIDRVMARKNPAQTSSFFRGDPSYEESRRDIVLGIDLLATQYAAYRADAVIEAIRGNDRAAQMYLGGASDVKGLINSAWWNPEAGYFFAFMDGDHKFQGRAGVELLYRDAADNGAKTQGALDTLLEKIQRGPASGIESESHFAEILYRYGKPEQAYAEIIDLSRPGRERQEYPEVSYSVIGAIVNGLMGINVEPELPIEDIMQGKRFETIVRTLPQLTAKTSWAELRNLPIGEGAITVRHCGERRTILTNHEKTDLTWEAAFPGSYTTLVVSGKPINAHTEFRRLGSAVTWVRVQVKPWKSLSVEIPQMPKQK
jgi:hypothetical protein